MSATVLLAGRRPDPADAEVPRFPIENAVLVRERIRALFSDRRPSHLVCSAACGADLLALDVAGDAEIERHVVLPFQVDVFRETSVMDRPGRWGALFDRVVREVTAEGRLRILDGEAATDSAYAAVNDVLLRTALGLDGPLLAVIVWDGHSRGEGDLTAHLASAASKANGDILTVSTL